MVGRVRLRLVVRRDLQVAAGLEVDVPELDPAPPRLPGLLPPRRDGADQGLGVEQAATDLREGAEEVLGHDYLTAAMTTISSNPTSASGMTRRRWRGFTRRV